MIKKIYTIENLDCAHCAAKAEANIQKVPGVRHASITFTTMQLQLEAEDPDALLPQVLAAARKVEPKIQFHPQEHSCHHSAHSCHCHCDHDHHQHHDHEHHDHHHEHHDSNGELLFLLIGAGFFLAGVLLSAFLPAIPLHLPAFLLAYWILGKEVLLTAGKNILRGKLFDENFLMSLATLGAFVIGEYPEAVGVMLFFRIGEFFEHRAVQRSRSRIMEAVDLRPETVTLRSGETIPAEAAKPGDLLLVHPGDRIPLDGIVVAGESYLDTAPITGEPVPLRVQPGQQVISGCINQEGQLVIRAEKPLSESMVTRILNSVENAAAGKPKIQRFISRFAGIYTPIVVFIALVTAILPSLFTGEWSYWVYTALSFLVMSCPCALVISVPLSFFSGIGAGSKKGILFKDGITIEALARVKAVVMDKTGTLTKGSFQLQSCDPQLLTLCASCEQFSTHPIAKSILTAAKEQGLSLAEPESVEELSGLGIRAILNGREILCGNEKLLAKFGIFPDIAPASSGETQIHISENGNYLGSLRICDVLKPDAKEAVKKLARQGIATAILTGDRQEAAKATAEALAVDHWQAGLLPQEKVAHFQTLRQTYGPVMFVGDGINDAPVLAGADVGAAMGNGADAAIEAADVVFMGSEVAAIPAALELARQTKAIAWQNVIFALAIKAAVMVLGLLGFASMWAAVFADSGVAMLCILNAIRLLYKK